MIQRNESKPKQNRRQKSQRAKKRRLMLEGLEQRQLLAVGIPTLPQDIDLFTGPRNIGTTQATSYVEAEPIGTPGLNDSIFNAEFVNLGTGPGQDNTIDITGSMDFVTLDTVPATFITDIDTYAVNLRAGDILDISLHGSAGSLDVFYANGTRWFATDDPQGIFYPGDSPLQTTGNINAAQVVPEDGTYYITTSPIGTDTSYTLGLRAYRPISEQLPIGTGQTIYLNFDGGIYPRNIFTDGSGTPQPGIIRFPSLLESLPELGLNDVESTSDPAYNELIDKVLAEVELNFASVVKNGNNGDYNTTGIPGQYGVSILNSRDHANPGPNPYISVVHVGGTEADAEQNGIIGLSSTLDIGNFSMDDITIVVLDSIVPTATIFPISNTKSVIDAAARLIGTVISHEAAHSFGLRHTNNENNQASLIDAGEAQAVFGQYMGIGQDGIFGTNDDEEIEFVTDQFEPEEGIIGFQRSADSLAFSLATGTAGTAITGSVFNDLNRNGVRGTTESGLAGVTVFADLDGDGVRDATEPSSVSGADGTFTLGALAGDYSIIALPLASFAQTTPGSVAASSGSISFGYAQINPNNTGSIYVDNDGDGVRDANESGLAGVFVYADLDGDNRPDLGEPNATTAADGTYSLNFPGAGEYTIRTVTPDGFTLSFPDDGSGECIVNFDGLNASDNCIFGFLPSTDYGDAPDTYGTTKAADGASHGIIAGLSIGSSLDREINGVPTTLANGDDLAGADDEDGVRQLGPLGIDGTSQFAVTVTNTTGAPSYLQAFLDFNGDGDFADAGEQFVSNQLVASGTVGSELIIPVDPRGATVGDTYARFRLSQTRDIGATGFVASGEVEDYAFEIRGSTAVAQADEFSIPRNSLANTLDVLGNDFEADGTVLTIDSINLNGTRGSAARANDGRSVLYTPPLGFIGRDTFSYTVTDQFGNRSTATVFVNVTFQSNVPIAVDDSFDVPEGSQNRPLNVLENDLPSLAGGVSIISVTPGSAGGSLQIIGGGLSLRYTPLAGFNGTEQFTYTIQDGAGSLDTATVTVNLLPGSRLDDEVEFTIDIFDPININNRLDNVQVGQEFVLKVSVEDIADFSNPRGVASAFLDVLYTDELVAVLDTDTSVGNPFPDVTFGPLFGSEGLQRINALTPGLIDDAGAVQPLTGAGGLPENHVGPTELFSLRMMAIAPGIAVFVGDPADDAISETIINSDLNAALTPSQLRFVNGLNTTLSRTELLIQPASDDFPSAIDDSFPTSLDSDGALISSTATDRNRLDVLANDILGVNGPIREFDLLTGASLGNVFVDDNGTPTVLDDDFLSYRANVGANGLEQFSYFFVSSDGIRSTAEVTFPIGNARDNADVEIDFELVSASGTPITSVAVGERFGVQVNVEDVRDFSNQFIFAAFLDVLYNSDYVRPADTISGDEFDFDVTFAPEFREDAGVGTAARLGIIDEFGSLLRGETTTNTNPALMATIFFDAIAATPGGAPTSIVGSPADSFPFQDTLIFGQNDPVPVSQIRYDKLDIVIGGSTGTTTPRARTAVQNPTLPQDVNNDGSVSPIDALLIINEMGSSFAQGESSELLSSYYTDVNGDSKMSAIDALQVINYLAGRERNGEGETVAAALPTVKTDLSSQPSNDAVFAEADDADLVVDTSASASASVSPIVIAASASDASDDDEEDVLSLLADDVAGRWS